MKEKWREEEEEEEEERRRVWPSARERKRRVGEKFRVKVKNGQSREGREEWTAQKDGGESNNDMVCERESEEKGANCARML